MTDKEQIIEGADISKCFFSRYDENEKIYICDLMDFDEHYFNCDKNPNCYYKQLQCKTAECEELKERLDRTEEDLKYQCVDCMNVKSDRYHKALEEIEKVCIKDTREFADGTTVRYDSLDDILNIINKAKGR